MMHRIALSALALALIGLGSLSFPSEAAGQRGGAVRVAADHAGNVHQPQFSPDGTSIAYEVNFPAEKRTELWMVGWDGSKITGAPTKLVPESMSTTRRYGAGKRVTHGLSWSGSGAYRYAYSVSDSTGAQDIYIDSWSQMVESQGSANKNPSWDPTEARFVFSSGRSGNGDLYLWDQGQEMRITYDEQNAELYPSFSPAGGKVVYVRQGKAGSHIYFLDVDQFTPGQALVQYEGKESTRPSFSPDGSKVAFFSNKATDAVIKFGLWVTDARPGSTPRNIAPNVLLPSKGGAHWTPDGKGVVAVKDDPDAGDPICIFPVDGGTPNCLTGTGTRNNRDPSLLVAGGQWRVVFTSQTKKGDAEATWQEMYVYAVPR